MSDGRSLFGGKVTISGRITAWLIILVASISAMQTGVPPEVSTQLESPDWSIRNAGFESLIALPPSPEVETALILLLLREDPLQAARMRNTNKDPALDGEGYGEYFLALSGTVNQIAENDPARPGVWTALFGFPCVPRWQGTYDERRASCLIDVMEGKESVYPRGQTAEDLGKVLQDERDPKKPHHLSPPEVAALDRIIRRELRDRDDEVRSWACFFVAETGTLKDLPVLQRIAKTDPAARTGEDGKVHYWIREHAPRDINILRARFTRQDWAERRQSLAIKADEKPSPDIDTRRIAFLLREDEEFANARKQGFSAPAYYYDYFEYLNAVVIDVLAIADKNPERTDVWPALFGYPDVLPEWFATHGDRAASYFLAVANGRKSPYDRATAFEVLAETIVYERDASTQHHLEPEEVIALDRRLRSGVKDADQKMREASDALHKWLQGETASPR
jgi:hypothetical protein